MNSNRSSNQGQGKAKGKNRPNKGQPKRKQREGKGRSGNPGGKGPNSNREEFAAAYAKSAGAPGKPRIDRASYDSCRVSHREFIGNVTGSVAFALSNTFAINPALAASFPWLSTMAQSWQRYRFRYLRFKYLTRTGTATPGSVMLAMDPDAADANPATEVILSTYWCKESACYVEELCLEIPSHLLAPARGEMHFTRTAALAANLDIKTYDVGNFFVGTVDGTAVNWGKLWVEYQIDLMTPQLPPAGPFVGNGGMVTGATAQTGANPFGTAPTVDAQAQGIAMSAASVLSFANPGTYSVCITYVGTVISAVAAPTVGAGCTFTNNTQPPIFNAAGTVAMQEGIVIVTTPATATLAFSLTATTVTGASCLVAQAPASSMTAP